MTHFLGEGVALMVEWKSTRQKTVSGARGKIEYDVFKALKEFTVSGAQS